MPLIRRRRRTLKVQIAAMNEKDLVNKHLQGAQPEPVWGGDRIRGSYGQELYQRVPSQVG